MHGASPQAPLSSGIGNLCGRDPQVEHLTNLLLDRRPRPCLPPLQQLSASSPVGPGCVGGGIAPRGIPPCICSPMGGDTGQVHRELARQCVGGRVVHHLPRLRHRHARQHVRALPGVDPETGAASWEPLCCNALRPRRAPLRSRPISACGTVFTRCLPSTVGNWFYRAKCPAVEVHRPTGTSRNDRSKLELAITRLKEASKTGKIVEIRFIAANSRKLLARGG